MKIWPARIQVACCQGSAGPAPMEHRAHRSAADRGIIRPFNRCVCDPKQSKCAARHRRVMQEGRAPSPILAPLLCWLQTRGEVATHAGRHPSQTARRVRDRHAAQPSHNERALDIVRTFFRIIASPRPHRRDRRRDPRVVRVGTATPCCRWLRSGRPCWGGEFYRSYVLVERGADAKPMAEWTVTSSDAGWSVRWW